MTKEEAGRRAEQQKQSNEVNAHNNLHHHHIPEKPSMDGDAESPLRTAHSPRDDREVERTLAEAEKSTDKQTGKKGRRRSEEEKPDRTLGTHTNDARISTTLPIVQEAGENGSRHSSRRGDDTFDEKRDSVDNDKRNDIGEMDDTRKEQTTSASEDQQPGVVEYTVTDDDHHLFHHHQHEDEQHMQAPLDDQEVEDEKKRRSKPPRIESGIIPPTTPMYGEDEIGIAR